VAALPEDLKGAAQAGIERLVTANCPRVEVVVSHSGSDGAIIRALQNDPINMTEPLRGIVVSGTGNGAIHEGMEVALGQARQAGILVWRTTRCAYGEVVLGSGAGTGELPAANTSAVKARIDMILALMQ
jgi:L-asparaginase